MKITIGQLKDIIQEEVQNVLNEVRPGENAPKKETVATFVDDPDEHHPFVRNPKTGERWVRYDPMGPTKVLDPDSLNPEDRAEYFQDQYDVAAEKFGDNHPNLRRYKKDLDDAIASARAYAQKYNIKDSDFYKAPETTIDPSIKPHDTKSFGPLLKPETADTRLYYTPTEVTESIKK